MYSNGDWRVSGFLSGPVNYYLPVIAANLSELVNGEQLGLTQFTIASRILSICLISSLSVIFIYSAADILGGRTTALVASSVFTISPMVLGNSRVHYPDHYIIVFSAWVLYLSLKILLDGRRRSFYILGGIAVGLAAAVKYNGILLFAPLGLAHLLTYRDGSALERSKLFVRDYKLLIYLAVCSGLVFFVLNWSARERLELFVRDFQTNISNYEGGGRWLETTNGYLFYASVLGLLSFGILAVIPYFLGLISLIRKRPHLSALLVILPILLALSLGGYKRVTVRNMVMALPWLILILTVGLQALADWARSQKNLTARIGCYLLLACCFVEPITKTAVALTRDFAIDSRIKAGEWMEGNLTPGTVISAAWTCSYPLVDNSRFTVKEVYPPFTREGLASEPCSRYVIVDSWFHWNSFEGLQGRMFTEPVHANIHFINPSGFRYELERNKQEEASRYLMLVKRFSGYGPEVELYWVDPAVCF